MKRGGLKRGKTMPLPPLEVLHSLFEYRPETGEVWTRPRPAGHTSTAGRKCVTYKKQPIHVSRLAWLLMTGEDPGGKFIDHINGDPTDDRWGNLRLADESQNMWNKRSPSPNCTGFRGVYRQANSKSFAARISVKKKRINLGSFPTAEEAHEAYKAAALKYHGEFARTS